MQSVSLLHGFLEASAIQFPDKTALIHGNQRFSYTQVNSLADRVAAFIVDQGVRAGDRVVILFENGLEYVASYYGTLKAGAVSVPLNTDLKSEGLSPILQEIRPKAIVASAKSERLLKDTYQAAGNDAVLVIKGPAQKWVGKTIHKWEEIVMEGGGVTAAAAPAPDDLASVVYTSGSTGTPKGVMLTHANLVSNVKAICKSLKLSSDDIQMVVLPFFYVMGKSLLNTHFAVGGTIVINNQFAFPAAVLNQMVEEQVTGFSGVPSTYSHLLHRSPLKKYREKLTALRYCSQAGGHMARKVKEALLEVLPTHTDLIIMYGATEAAPRLSSLSLRDCIDKIDSIGQPIENVTIKVMDPYGYCVQTGQDGELVANGPNIMAGYWQDPELTSSVLDSDGYHTGDIGYQDEDGFFFIRSRKDNMLKVGGHRINPREIEDAIVDTGLAIEAAVVGLPDELLVNRLSALIVATGSKIDKGQILQALSLRLPKFKIPSEVTMVRTIPKNASGKIDRYLCLGIAEGAQASQVKP